MVVVETSKGNGSVRFEPNKAAADAADESKSPSSKHSQLDRGMSQLFVVPASERLDFAFEVSPIVVACGLLST